VLVERHITDMSSAKLAQVLVVTPGRWPTDHRLEQTAKLIERHRDRTDRRAVVLR